MAQKETKAVVAPVGAPAKKGKKLPAQLVQISDKVITNINGTEFRACSVILDGDETTYSAMIWEKSVSTTKLGNCRVECRVEGQEVFMTVLGNGAARITLASLMALTGDADLEGEF